ncbi:MAG: M35 family metallo-endopeptidase [Gaiellaceae bacterium]
MQGAPRGHGHDFAAIGVEKKPGVAHGPGGTNKFEDCPPAWKTKADAAAQLGASWVANVITGLSSLPTPLPAPVAALLNRHFHTTYDKDIRKIVGHYRQINAAINSAIDFECETECDKDVHAYVYSVWTDVHICPLWFKAGPSSQANTIVHELAHDVAGRDDEAYIWEPKYKTLSVDDAIDNADSYSHFAQEAFGP